jgi:plasmid stabilization system protein ParE
MLSGTPQNYYANILLWGPAMIRTIRNFRVCAHGRSPDIEAIRIYYLLDNDAIRVIRVLHGKRDLNRIPERERTV